MKCPFCQGEIQDGAKKCQHCGEWIKKPLDMKLNKAGKDMRGCGCALLILALVIFIFVFVLL